MAKKRKKKPRLHFKLNLERIARHIGKVIDKTSVKDIQEAIFIAALTYVSYEGMGGPHAKRIPEKIGAALFGPISLKLAQADNLASGTAGVAGLSVLGLAFAGGQVVEWIKDPKKGLIAILTGKEGPLRFNRNKGEWETIPEEEIGFVPY